MDKKLGTEWKKDRDNHIHMDDLMKEIHKTEAIDLPGFMDKEQQERVEARILAGIQELQKKTEINEKEEMDGKIVPLRRKNKKKRFFILGIAAIMLLGLCLTAFASSNPDWDIELLRFMGLDESDTFQLESGEVKIQVYDSFIATEYDAEGNPSEKEVKIMAVSSIGDKNSACIRIETDYELPEGFDETTDYIMPGNYSLNVYEKPGKIIEKGWGSTMGYMNLDGKLGYMIYITGCQGLNKSHVKVRFEDFYLYHDLEKKEEEREEELLLKGKWELTWRYAYKSNVRSYQMLKRIELDDVPYYITDIEVSPLSVQINGFRMPWNRKKDYAGFKIERIQYKDGTGLEVGGWSSAGNHNGMVFDTFLGTTEMKTTIDVNNIKSIVIGENEIILK